jgi:DNA-nicking Smr family endonuclease
VDKEELLKEKSVDQTPMVRTTSQEKVIEIDLHGKQLREACEHLSNFIEQQRKNGVKTLSLKVITGKGRHSQNGLSSLPAGVHDFVLKKYRDYIKEIQESPAAVKISGLPIRGHFDVKFKF